MTIIRAKTKENKTAKSIILIDNLVLQLEDIHPGSAVEIQRLSQDIFKKALNRDSLIGLLNIFNPFARNNNKSRQHPHEYWINAHRVAIRQFIGQQERPIASYCLTNDEKLFLGYKTCQIINFPQHKIRS